MQWQPNDTLHPTPPNVRKLGPSHAQPRHETPPVLVSLNPPPPDEVLSERSGHVSDPAQALDKMGEA